MAAGPKAHVQESAPWWQARGVEPARPGHDYFFGGSGGSGGA